MIRRYLGTVALLAGLSLGIVERSHAQSKNRYVLGQVTGAGMVVGNYISYDGQASQPSNYSIEWSIQGTPPLVCTLQPQATSDPSSPFFFFSNIPDQDCTKRGKIFFQGMPVVFFQVVSPLYTPGDGTTVVTVRYNRGSN